MFSKHPFLKPITTLFNSDHCSKTLLAAQQFQLRIANTLEVKMTEFHTVALRLFFSFK